jgi:hypothetical protein
MDNKQKDHVEELKNDYKDLNTGRILWLRSFYMDNLWDGVKTVDKLDILVAILTGKLDKTNDLILAAYRTLPKNELSTYIRNRWFHRLPFNASCRRHMAEARKVLQLLGKEVDDQDLPLLMVNATNFMCYEVAKILGPLDQAKVLPEHIVEDLYEIINPTPHSWLSTMVNYYEPVFDNHPGFVKIEELRCVDIDAPFSEFLEYLTDY